LFVEFLLACGECELVTAIAAHQCFVFEAHRSSPGIKDYVVDAGRTMNMAETSSQEHGDRRTDRGA
jgi:hypothetical protein